MPGVQNVIGNHKSTIFQRSTTENCTRVNTKSEQGIDCEFRWMVDGGGVESRKVMSLMRNSLAFS